jgi:RimJ/RimL family protein N-acetyltransferase
MNGMTEETRFPEVLESERLILRRYAAGDAAGLLDLVEKNRELLVADEKQANLFVEEKIEQWNSRKGFCYGIWLKESQELIGQLLVKNIVWDIPSAELSYFVGSAFQRRGYASEAIAALVGVGFMKLGFARIFVRIIPSNRESILLANKLRFRHEGLHRKEFRCGNGELHDVHYFSLTSEDYRADIN